jgi:phosphatidylserine decarboxylase
VLGADKEGWFGESAKKDLMEVANGPLKSSHKFEDMYICDPEAKCYGFKSWDGKSSIQNRRVTALTVH